MNKQERDALEAAGFRVGDAEDFLELTDEERRLVELRVAISRAVRGRREEQGLTQGQVARKLKTSQPRVAMIEAGAAAVSLDAMFRGLFVLGGGLEDLQAGRPAPAARRSGAAKAVVRDSVTGMFRDPASTAKPARSTSAKRKAKRS
jgi:transcriptional regulator with XRE-family HTH domain